MREPIWIDLAIVETIHALQLAEHGGQAGTRDQGLLESALERPRNRWRFSSGKTTLPALAASLAHGIVKNHPFVDGNKRTAWVLCRTFLILNKMDITASQAEKADVVVRLASDELSEEEFIDWLSVRLINLASQ